MNRQQAIEAMKCSCKIRHTKLFLDDEWIAYGSGLNLVDEKGYELNEDEFWALRPDSNGWGENWEIVDNNTETEGVDDNEGGYEPEEGEYYPANHVDPMYDANNDEDDDMQGEREFMRNESKHSQLTEDEQIIYGL